jgi:hypothetical protein
VAEQQLVQVDRPVVGYRAWLVSWTANPCRLLATCWAYAWEPLGVIEARCLFTAPPRRPSAWAEGILARAGRSTEPHEAPASHCKCGLYAYDSLSSAHEYARSERWPNLWQPGPDNLIVLGAVVLWGAPGRPVRVGELAAGCPDGLRYRAPFARVLALMGPEHSGDIAHQVGEELGLPVVPERWLEPYAREHGEQLRPREGRE